MTKAVQRSINRTGTALCELCTEQTYLVQHHIEGRDIPNADSNTNLINICSNCHLLIHRGDIIIEKKCMTTAGYQLLWHYVAEESVTQMDSKCYQL